MWYLSLKSKINVITIKPKIYVINNSLVQDICDNEHLKSKINGIINF